MSIPEGPILVGILIGSQVRWFSPGSGSGEDYAAVAILDPAGERSYQPQLEGGGFFRVPAHRMTELQERLGQALQGCAAYLGQLVQYCEPTFV